MIWRSFSRLLRTTETRHIRPKSVRRVSRRFLFQSCDLELLLVLLAVAVVLLVLLLLFSFRSYNFQCTWAIHEFRIKYTRGYASSYTYSVCAQRTTEKEIEFAVVFLPDIITWAYAQTMLVCVVFGLSQCFWTERIRTFVLFALGMEAKNVFRGEKRAQQHQRQEHHRQQQ